MTSALYYPDLVSSQLKLLDADTLPVVEIEESRIAGYATRLAEQFIQDKKRLHASFKSDPAYAGDALFSPLILSARYINGSLQITWKEVHLIARKDGRERWKKRVHIPRGNAGNYNIASLRKSAGYAAELVEDYELKARDLRKFWQQLMVFKKNIYAAIRRLPALDAASAPATSPASQPSAEPAIIDTLVPKPEPPPIPPPDKPRTISTARRL